MNDIMQETDMIRFNSQVENRVISHIPEDIKSLIHSNPGTFIAGGYLRDLVGNLIFPETYVKKTPSDDIDIFFTNREATDRMCVSIDKAIKEGKAKLIPNNHYKDGYDSENNLKVVLKYRFLSRENEYKLNLCSFPKFFPRPQDIGRNFNYVINCICYDGNEIWVHEYFMYDIQKGILNLINLCDPITHIVKMQKYINYGFRVTQETAMRMVFKIKMGDYGE